MRAALLPTVTVSKRTGGTTDDILGGDTAILYRFFPRSLSNRPREARKICGRLARSDTGGFFPHFVNQLNLLNSSYPLFHRFRERNYIYNSGSVKRGTKDNAVFPKMAVTARFEAVVYASIGKVPNAPLQ